MSKKPSMKELIKELNNENAYEILSLLKDMHNEEGKNAVITALESKQFEKAYTMLQPIKKPDKDEYVILFNPFKNAVTKGTKPLKWPKVPEKMQYLSDFTGILDTKDSYYDFYSIYSYIECMDNELAKECFEELVMNVPYQLFSKIKIQDVPDPIENREAVVYTSEDIVRYYPIPLVPFITDLFTKGIEAKTTFSKNQCLSIIINSKDLSDRNIVAADTLIKFSLASTNGSNIVIDIDLRKNPTLKEIEERLVYISNIFVKQIPVFEKINIDKYYERLKMLMNRLGVNLPENPDREEKIKLCRKYNRKLTLDETESFFYLHPGIKERVEQENEIKL